MLCLSRKEGEKVLIGDNVVVTIRAARGGVAHIGIDAPRGIPIFRAELKQSQTPKKPRKVG